MATDPTPQPPIPNDLPPLIPIPNPLQTTTTTTMDGFLTLDEGIYLHDPIPNPKSLIILCTWLGGATPPRIAKYTAGYRARFPDASILVLTTTIPDITFRPFTTVRTRLTPARETITRILNSQPDANILLHIFSHGGANISIQLARSMLQTNPAYHARFMSALRLVLFDCCPGDNAFKRSYDAAAYSLPKTRLGQSLGRLLLYPTIGAITTFQRLNLMRNIWNLRSDLNDPTVLGTTARRFYLYSRDDRMVPWLDVEEHMRDARGCGYVADGVRFDRGGHCALVVANGERYWGAIRRAWEGEVPPEPAPLVVQSVL